MRKGQAHCLIFVAAAQQIQKSVKTVIVEII